VVQDFTYRSARSGGLLLGLGIALLVETVALHLWLVERHPAIAWTLTIASIATLLWLAADYRATSRGAVRLSDDALDLRVGYRFAARIARRDVASVARAGWRDVPAPGTPMAEGYINLMKPSTPNILLTLVTPTQLRLPGGVRRSVQRIGLHLDEPQCFLNAFGQERTQVASRDIAATAT
jgi:hypothetical protein